MLWLETDALSLPHNKRTVIVRHFRPVPTEKPQRLENPRTLPVGRPVQTNQTRHYHISPELTTRRDLLRDRQTMKLSGSLNIYTK